ncbi:MAG: hypothetical protein WHT64_09810 [Desulfomicrobiaceae bacterium]
MTESVLCTPTAALPQDWLPQAGAIAMDMDAWLHHLAPVPPHWVPRTEAEGDPSWKQWIPYAILQDSAGRIAAYPRHGSESRLHGLWSIGVGGHVNPQDARRPFCWKTTLIAGLLREIQEEFPAAGHGDSHFCGLVHESRTAVGAVHIGAVFLHHVDICDAAPAAELAGLQWLPPQELRSLPLELWSALALDLLP